MNANAMNDEERIDTEIAQVRLCAPPHRGRTVWVPADGATVSEVCRKAKMIGTFVVGYKVFSVANINGYPLSSGALREERAPNWEPRSKLEEYL